MGNLTLNVLSSQGKAAVELLTAIPEGPRQLLCYEMYENGILNISALSMDGPHESVGDTEVTGES